MSRLSSSFLSTSTRSLLSLDSSYRSVTTNTDFSSEGAQVSLDACKDRWVNHLLTNPDLQIAVIGGGIYGCHFAQAFNVACGEASSILNKAIGAKLVIFEKDDALFSQASGKNSFRIHKGFHYPRTGNTRSMCYNDHNKFVHQYPHFFQTAFDEEKNEDIPAFSKVFAIAKDDKTKLDYDAMRNLLNGAKYQDGQSMWDETDGELWSEEIRRSPDANIKREQLEELGFNPALIDGAFLVQVEPILYADKPGLWFTSQFTSSPFIELKMSQSVDGVDIQESKNKQEGIVIHDMPFDLVLNCTYNQAIPLQLSDHTAFYDLCISVIVAEKVCEDRLPAVSFGIFDGPYPSLEPYDFVNENNLPDELQKYQGRNLFQIFDVELSSIARSSCPIAAYELMSLWEEKKQNSSKEYEQVVKDVWEKCNKYFPRLGGDFELAGTWFALKTKVEDENASRPLIVVRDETIDKAGRFVQVFSSKLTSIFDAEEAVLDIMDIMDEELMF